MKHSPLHIPRTAWPWSSTVTASGSVAHDRRARFRNSEPLRQRPCVCTNSDGLRVCAVGHGVVLLHASGSVAHDIDGTASVVIGTQSVSCEPLNIERKRTACVPASGIKRIVANHSKRIIARTQDTQRRLDHGACVWSSACVCVRNSKPLHALQYLHAYALSIAQAIARTEPACVPCVRRY